MLFFQPAGARVTPEKLLQAPCQPSINWIIFILAGPGTSHENKQPPVRKSPPPTCPGAVTGDTGDTRHSLLLRSSAGSQQGPGSQRGLASLPLPQLPSGQGNGGYKMMQFRFLGLFHSQLFYTHPLGVGSAGLGLCASRVPLCHIPGVPGDTEPCILPVPPAGLGADLAAPWGAEVGCLRCDAAGSRPEGQ